MREKINKLYASIIALAFVLCAFVFSPPDVSASQSQPFSKDSVCAKSQVETAAVNQAIVSADFNAVLPLADDLTDFRVTRQYSPPIARKLLPEKNRYKGLNRQRPEQPPNRS